MSDFDPDLDDQNIKALFGSDKTLSVPALTEQRREAITRARANVAQRDTILFAFIKIWTVLADLLAPLFASFAAKRNIHIKPAGSRKQSKK